MGEPIGGIYNSNNPVRGVPKTEPNIQEVETLGKVALSILSITPLAWGGYVTPKSISEPEGKVEPVAGKCYTGAFVADMPIGFQGEETAKKIQELQAKIQVFQNAVGKHLSIVLGFEPWGGKDKKGNPIFLPFPKPFCDVVYANGSIPFIKWEPWRFAREPGKLLEEILKGRFDKDLERWFEQAMRWGHSIFLSFGHEMNKTDYPWAGFANGGPDGGPELYKAAWRHVYEIAEKVSREKFNGKTNITWIWCPDAESDPDVDWNIIENYYPGNDVVDWIGIDGYNFGEPNWKEAGTIFDKAYERLRVLGKPMMIAEFASSEDGDSRLDQTKEKWISQAEPVIAKFNGFIWFNLKKEENWLIYSSEASLRAFQRLMNNPQFIGDTLLGPRMPKPEEMRTLAEKEIEGKKGVIARKESYFRKPGLFKHPLLEFDNRMQIGREQVDLKNYQATVEGYKTVVEKSIGLKSWTPFYYDALLSLVELYLSFRDNLERTTLKVFTSGGEGRELILPDQVIELCKMLVSDPEVNLGYKTRAAVDWLIALDGRPERTKETDDVFKSVYSLLQKKWDWYLWGQAMLWLAEPKYRSGLEIACDDKPFDPRQPEKSGALSIYNELIRQVETKKPKNFDQSILAKAKIQAADLEVRKKERLNRAQRLYNEVAQDIAEEWSAPEPTLLGKAWLGMAEYLILRNETYDQETALVYLKKVITGTWSDYHKARAVIDLGNLLYWNPEHLTPTLKNALLRYFGDKTLITRVIDTLRLDKDKTLDLEMKKIFKAEIIKAVGAQATFEQLFNLPTGKSDNVFKLFILGLTIKALVLLKEIPDEYLKDVKAREMLVQIYSYFLKPRGR